MRIEHTRIKYTYGETIDIIPLFDIHKGNKYCDERALKKTLEMNSQAYFILGGDTNDAIVVTDPRYRKSADATDTDEIIDEQVESTYDIFKPYKKNILGYASGNHEDVITKKCGTNPAKRVASMLGVPFLGYSCLYKLYLETKIGGTVRTVVIRLHHGWGGGSRTQGADLTKYSKDLQYWDADVFLYGHVHRLQSDKVPRLGLRGNKLISRPKTMVLCGTYLKTYSDNDTPTYSEIKGYPPVEIGSPIIHMKPDSNGWVDIKVDT